MESRKILVGILCAFLVIILTSKVEAASVYAITKHSDSLVKVYNVVGDQIELQLVCDDFPGSSAVDLALSSGSDTLFASYDGSATITMYNAKTMEDEGYINPPGEISGMDFCESDQQLLAIGRDTKDLYVYDYNPETRDLTYNDTIDLANLTSEVFGICLDEHENILYVADNSNIVKYYDASSINFTYLGGIEIEEDGKGYEAVGIDVYNDDQGHKYLYSGAWVHTGLHNSLVRTDLNITDPNDPNYIIVKKVDTSILGVAVDKEAEYSGLVYVTTASGLVAVFDTSDWATDPCASAEPTDHEDVSSPAGLVVGSQYKPSWKIYLDKDDGLDPCDPCSPQCYAPGDEFTYTITYGHNGYDHEWVEVTDLLPRETTFLSSTPQWNDYDPDENSYFWDLGSLTTNDPNDNTITIDVLVNEMAEPNGIIINTAIIETDVAYEIIKVRTPICCWEDPCSVSGVIYVNGMLDPNSTYNTGTSWESAYIDLQSALRRAGVCGAEIWVAMDTYSPGRESTDSFVIPDTVEVYGGFIGDETGREQRDFVGHKTYLTGYISEELRNDKVVTMGDDTILDGFIIKDSRENCVLGENANFTIANCIVTGSYFDGIYCKDGNLIINWCVIKNNDDDGIFHSGTGKLLTVNNCRIYDNNENGIYCYNSTPTVINSMIHHNGSDGTDYYGIKLYEPSDKPDIRNNTIVYNQNEGIYFTGNNAPDINNCILWYNNEADDLTQLAGCGTTYHSCVTDPNDLPGSGDPDGNGNINCDPCFAYSDPDLGNFHLDPDSECIDRGDNSVVDPESDGEYDIDGDDRIVNGGNGLIVDMGADEMACEDITHPYDFNHDGIINLHEFADLSGAWLLDDNDPNWADTYVKCDFYADGQIDILDLREFAEVWLWQACYRLNGVSLMMFGGGGGMDKTMSAPTIAKMPTKAEVERGRIAKWQRNLQPPLIEQIEVTEKLLDDGTKIEFLAYSTGDFLAKIVTDPKGNITHFIIYLNDGNRMELICTYDSMGNETSAIYTHYDADGNIILVERMEDDMLLEQK